MTPMARFDGPDGTRCHRHLRLSVLERTGRRFKSASSLWGITLQFAFAFLVLKTDFGKIFYAVSLFVNALLNYTLAGSTFRVRR